MVIVLNVSVGASVSAFDSMEYAFGQIPLQITKGLLETTDATESALKTLNRDCNATVYLVTTEHEGLPAIRFTIYAQPSSYEDAEMHQALIPLEIDAATGTARITTGGYAAIEEFNDRSCACLELSIQ